KRFWNKKISRRRLLHTGALGAGGLAVAATVGCGSRDNNTTSSGGTGGAVTDFLQLKSPDVIDGRQKFATAPADSRGGTLTYVGYDPVVLDRYDPHQTQFGPMYENTSGVFSKLYMYASHEQPTWDNILPDL